MSRALFVDRIRHVLLVEDSPMIAMDMEATLYDFGIELVSLAGTVAEALALIETRPVDVALLDLFLGTETSVPVAEELALRGIPFALATGYGDAPDLLARFAEVPLLRKPHSPDQLKAVLASLC